MSAKPCKCGMPKEHAKAVESAVFTCLMNASVNPEREDYWRNHADLLEKKFTTEHSRHYSYFLYDVC